MRVLKYMPVQKQSVTSQSRAVVQQIMWPLVRVCALYVRLSPLELGKGFLVRSIIPRLLPGGSSTFKFHLVNGKSVELRYQETLGLAVTIYGGFEQAEQRKLYELTTKESVVYDVGANVGLYTILLADRANTICAFEPFEENLRRLRSGLDELKIRNVEVVESAVGSENGHIEIRVADDPAYVSTKEVAGEKQEKFRVNVPLIMLDEYWRRQGRPKVDVIKLDVEGAELEALSGAAEILASSSPTLLVECNNSESYDAIAAFLKTYGYTSLQPDGFEAWNYLFQVQK